MGADRLSERNPRNVGFSFLLWIIRKLFMAMVLILIAAVLYGWVNNHPTHQKAGGPTSAVAVIHTIGTAGQDFGRSLHELIRRTRAMAASAIAARDFPVIRNGPVLPKADDHVFPTHIDSQVSKSGPAKPDAPRGTLYVDFGDGHGATSMRSMIHAWHQAGFRTECFAGTPQAGCDRTRQPPASAMRGAPLALTQDGRIAILVGPGSRFVVLQDANAARRLLSALTSSPPHPLSPGQASSSPANHPSTHQAFVAGVHHGHLSPR